MASSSQEAGDPVRVTETSQQRAKDLPVKNTFIDFNDFSPAMLPVKNSKSTPGYRFRDASFGMDDDEGSEAPLDSPQNVVGHTASYAVEPLSPMTGNLGVERTRSAKDEPAKIGAMSSLRGFSGALGTCHETGDTPASEQGGHSMFVRSTDTEKKVQKQNTKGFEEDDIEGLTALRDASMLSMRSVRFDDPDDTPIAAIASPMAVFIDEDRVLPEAVKEISTVKSVKSKKSVKKKSSRKKLQQLPSPVHIQTKHGFIHYDDSETPLGTSVGHALTAPPLLCTAGTSSDEYTDDSGEESDASSRGSWCSDASEASAGTAQVVVWRGMGLDRNSFLPQEEMAGQEAMRFSTLLQCRRVDGQLYNIGAQLHDEGRCVPCLMQCRFVGNRCAEPCRFGLLCNRCHEPHTEEELQKIQAQMRRLRKSKGGGGAGGNQRPS